MMQDVAADQLHIEVPHVEDTFSGFTHHGESFDQQVVQRLAVREALFELGGSGLELFVGEGGNSGLQIVDGRDNGLDLLQFAVVLGAYKLLNDRVEHI